MVSKSRAVRIADRMREELADLLVRQTNDPRLSGVSITDVEVDRELAYATIFFSSIEGAERADEIQAGFEHAQGFLRSELAHRISLRTFPRLRFRYDQTFERAENIEQLLNSLDQNSKPNDESE